MDISNEPFLSSRSYREAPLFVPRAIRLYVILLEID